MNNQANASPQSRKICWVSFLILDKDFHKTTQVEVLKNLNRIGHLTTLFGVYSKMKYENKTREVQIHSIPLRYVSNVTALLYTVLMFIYLPFYCLRAKLDYVIVEPREPTFLSVLPVAVIPKPARPKIILDIRSTPVSGSFSELAQFTVAIRTAKQWFDGITIITPMMREEVCRRFSIKPETMGIWTSGVSTEIFDPETYNKKDLKRKFGLNGKFVLFYHGSLGCLVGRTRGVAECIRALGLIKENNPQLVLFLLGDSASFNWIMQLSREIGVENKIVLHSSVEYADVPKYIGMCDAALVPLPNVPIWRNQCALKLLEYLAMEKVVIATDIPANRCVMGENKCGIYIPSAEPREIANAIAYVYQHKYELSEWGKDGRTIINEKYSWLKVAKDFEEHLLHL